MFCSLAEGVRVFYCYFSLNTSQNSQQESWVSETSLFVILIFTDTSQNRQNILQLFFEYVSKQSTKVMGLRDTLFVILIPPKTDKKHRDMTYLIDMTRHDNCQRCKLSKIESLRLDFTFSKPSLTDSSLKPCWRPRGIYVELESQKLEFHVDVAWNCAT